MNLRKILPFLPEARELVSKGFGWARIGKELGLDDETARLVYNISLAQVRYREKFPSHPMVDLDSARLGTHEVVAAYHARRLKTDVIADLGCGAGIQVAFFSKYSKRAYGVELNGKRAEMAKINAEILGNPERVRIIKGDVFSKDVVSEIADSDIIFSDPARPESETQRSLARCEPDPRKIVRVYSGVTDKFAFDIPPKINRERAKKELPPISEFEYISVGGYLNRLTVYSEPLAKSNISAVILPQGFRIEMDKEIGREFEITSRISKFLYELDGAVLDAGLIPEILEMYDVSLVHLDHRRAIFTSQEEYSTPAFRARFTVLGRGKNLEEILVKEGIGRIIPRFSLDPKRYYQYKRVIESKLRGKKLAYVFKIGDEWVIGKKF